MVAVAGGEDIKCSKYATFGTKNLSRNIIKALKNRSACLIALVPGPRATRQRNQRIGVRDGGRASRLERLERHARVAR